jgi:Uma2 family endonuclease
MAGESPAHADITSNCLGELNTQLRGTPCRAWTKDTKVRSGPADGASRKGMFSYPDIVVICGGPLFHDEHQDVVTNPTVIVEVLSETTQMFDRTLKFYRYRTWNSSLNDYILISQDQPVVECFSRQDDSSWVSRLYTGLNEITPPPVVDVTLALKVIYDRVSFRDDAD